MGKKWLLGHRMPGPDIILAMLVLFIIIPGGAALAANMQLNGHCYATISKEDGSGVTDIFDYVPAGLDVRIKGVDIQSGTFVDYTDLDQPHDTYRDANGVGWYRVQAKEDLTFTPDAKEGFAPGEQMHLFIYDERVNEGFWPGAAILLFYFAEGTSESGPTTSHFTNSLPAYVTSVDALPQPGGDIKLEWLLSPSVDADKYLIFYDNGTGTVDYGWQQEIFTLSHPTNSVTLTRRQFNFADGGTYRFSVRVQDKLGSREYTGHIYGEATSDASAPTVSIDVPAEGASYSGITVEVEGSIQDTNFDSYRVEYGEGNAPTAWFPVSVPLALVYLEKTNEKLTEWNITQTREQQDGLYTLRVIARDEAGNITTSSVSSIIDNQENFITRPHRYELIRGASVQIHGTATDPEFGSYRIYYGKGESPSSWHPIPIGDGSSGLYESTTPVTNNLLGTWDTRGFEGLYTVRLDIIKSTGVTVGREAIKVIVANAKPAMVITNPTEDTAWKYTEINVSGKAAANANITVETPETTSPLAAEINSDGTFTVYNVPLAVGANAMTITVTGPETNYSAGGDTPLSWNVVRTITVDTTAPALTVTAPLDNTIVRQGAVTVAGTTDPGSQVTVNGTQATVETNGSFTHVAIIPLGTQTITIEAIDIAGNVNTETRTISFETDITDYNPPVIELISPRPEQTINTATPTITFNVGDDYSGVDTGSIQVYIDGTAYAPVFTAADALTINATYTVTSNLSDGEHTLRLTASDILGNQAFPVETTFTVDIAIPDSLLWMDWNDSAPGQVTLHLVTVQDINPDDYTFFLYTEEFDTPISASSLRYPPDQPFVQQDLQQAITNGDWQGVRAYPFTEYFTTTFTIDGEILNRKLYVEMYDGTTLVDSSTFGSVLVYHDQLQSFTSDNGTTVVFQPNSFTNTAGGGQVENELVFHSREEERQNDQKEEHKIAARASQGLEKVGAGFEMQFTDLPAGVTDITLSPEFTVRLPYRVDGNGNVLDDDGNTISYMDRLGTMQNVGAGQLGVYIWDDDEKTYSFIGSDDLTVTTPSGTVNLVEGKSSRAGTFVVLADVNSPTIILNPALGEIIDARTEFRFEVTEKGSAIDSAAILLKVNEVTTIHFYRAIDDTHGEVFYIPVSEHTGDQITLTLTVPDKCSNSGEYSQIFQIREGFTIRENIPYPNPTRTDEITIRYVLTRDADSVVIKVFDLNGDYVTEIDGATASTYNDVLWDLTDYAGADVPNGSYLYRIDAARQGQAVSRTGKLSVLR